VPSFGAKLKLQREQRGVTLEQISETTKIGGRFLRALEDDRFDQLPGGIFNKGFVRSYARCVGMDEDEAVAGYLDATGANPDKPEPSLPLPEVRPEPRESQAADLPWGVLAILLLIAALGLAIWGFRNRQTERNQLAPPLQPANSSPTTVPSAAFGHTLAPAPANPSATPTPVGQAKSPPPQPPSAKPASKPLSSSSRPLGLEIRAREDSWISITVDGEVMMRDTMAAGTQKSIHASREILVKAGNVGGLDFEFNGKPMPSQGNIGEVRTLIFDNSGFHPAPVPPVPEDLNSPPQ